MNEFGEPNMGNPSVRFDEGRSGNAALATSASSIRLLPLRLLYYFFLWTHAIQVQHPIPPREPGHPASQRFRKAFVKASATPTLAGG